MVYKRSQGNIKLNHLRMKPEAYSCTPITVSLPIRICNDSTRKLILLPTFRNVDNSSSLISKVISSLLFRRSPKAANHPQRKLAVLGTSTLKCYSESSTLLPVLQQENLRSAFETLVKRNLASYAIYQPNHFNCLELYSQQTGAQHIIFACCTYSTIELFRLFIISQQTFVL